MICNWKRQTTNIKICGKWKMNNLFKNNSRIKSKLYINFHLKTLWLTFQRSRSKMTWTLLNISFSLIVWCWIKIKLTRPCCFRRFNKPHIYTAPWMYHVNLPLAEHVIKLQIALQLNAFAPHLFINSPMLSQEALPVVWVPPLIMHKKRPCNLYSTFWLRMVHWCSCDLSGAAPLCSTETAKKGHVTSLLAIHVFFSSDLHSAILPKHPNWKTFKDCRWYKMLL